MNDRYLFKAKRTDNGEWVEGYYAQLPKPSLGASIVAGGNLCAQDVADYIIVNTQKQHPNFSNGFPLEIVKSEQYEVDPGTLCQYTGSTDKNGKKIWENDIVKHHFRELYAPIKYGLYESCFDSTNTAHCGFYVDWDERRCIRKDLGYWINAVTAEVIGNIFDNPELLEVIK